MKISFDGKRAFHNFRGLGHYSRTLIDGLLNYFPENDYTAFTPLVEDDRALRWQKSHEGLKVIEPHSYAAKKFPTFWRSVFLTKLIKKENPDIYHGLSHEIPPGIDQLRTKSIVTIHDLLFLRYPEFFPYFDRLMYRRKYRYSCLHAHKIIAICEQTKSDIINMLGIPEEKIEVVYQSCDPIFYQKQSNDYREEIKKRLQLPEKYLLCVAALEPNKNVICAVKAFIHGEFKKSHSLVIVGKGERYKKKLEKIIIEHGVQSQVKFYDEVSQADLPGVYGCADVFLFPSFFEGFGRPIVEALCSGVPVITSQGSCFPEAGGEKTLYIDPHSPRELSEAIQRVLSSSELRDEMIEHGLNYAQKFRIEKTTENLMNLYRAVLDH